MSEIEELFDTIEILRCIILEYKSEHAKCLCVMTRQKIAWDWHKAQSLYRKRQGELVERCDTAVSDYEIHQFLKSQSLNLFIP